MNRILRTALSQTIYVFALFFMLTQVAGAQTTITALRLSETDRDITVGQTATATVTLSAAAPQGGTVVTLQSSQPAAATVPVNLTIPQGSTTGNFLITGAAPTGSTAAVITVSLGSSQVFEALAVRPAPVAPVWTLSLDPNTMLAPAGRVRATITLPAPAPAGGRAINIVAGDPRQQFSYRWLTYPGSTPLGGDIGATIVIPAGASTYVVTLAPGANANNPSALPMDVRVSTYVPCVPASSCSPGSPMVASQTLRILGNMEIASVSMSSATVYGGAAMTGTVTLTDPPSTDTPIQVQVTYQGPVGGGERDFSPAPVVPIVVARAGTNSATFTFQAPAVRNEGIWASSAHIVGGASPSKFVRFNIKPIIISDFRLTPVTVTGNRNSNFTVTGTVTLAGPAPVGGALIKPFPGMSGYGNHVGRFEFADFTIPQGQTSGTMTLTVGNISSDIDLPIIAIYEATNSRQTKTIAVRYAANPPPPPPPQLASNTAIVRPELAGGAVRPSAMSAVLASAKTVLSSISLNPGSVKAGAKTTLTATLSGAAPDGGAAVIVKLEGVSATLTIPKGQTSATTALAAPKVLKTTGLKVSAEYGGVTKIAELNITP